MIQINFLKKNKKMKRDTLYMNGHETTPNNEWQKCMVKAFLCITAFMLLVVLVNFVVLLLSELADKING